MSIIGNANVRQFGARPPVVDPLEKSFKTHNAAVEQQGIDYSGIMKGYQNMLAGAGQAGNQVTPQSYAYQGSPDVTSALATQKGLAETGGYSPEGIANIRERGISPIRSIYSSANRNLNRQRGLSGGYSPNMVAGQAKMAREMSEQMGGAMNNVNASLAQNIAGNRLQAAPQYAQTAGQQSGLQNQIGMANVESANAANKFNVGNKTDIEGRALQGMSGLYGTTPALVNTFGNQAMQGAGLQNTIQQQANATGLNQVGAGLRRY